MNIHRFLRPALVAAICLALAACASAPQSTSSGEWRIVALGLCEDYPEESRSLAQARADLRAARATGATVLRIAFGWDAIEPERGRYDWDFWDEFVRLATEEFGLRPIPYVCYTPRWAARDEGPDFWRSPPRDPEDFARFMGVIVARYREQIGSWELWNEPDNRAYWLGTPAEFAALVRAGSRAVRATDARDQVVLGGIAGETSFLAALFAEERIAPAVDVVNLHCYFETWHPDAIETLPAYVARAAEIVREHGEGEPLWMAELGYSSVGGRARVSDVYRAFHRGEHTDAAQAAALARKLVLTLATEQVDLVAWYRINDLPAAQDVIGDDNNLHLGIRDVEGRAKPAAAALRQAIDLLSGPHRAISARVTAAPAEAPAHVQAFRLRDGRTLLAAWLGRPETPPPAEPAEDRRWATLRIELPAFAAGAAQFTAASGPALESGRFGWQTRAGSTEVTLALSGSEFVWVILSPSSAGGLSKKN